MRYVQSSFVKASRRFATAAAAACMAAPVAGQVPGPVSPITVRPIVFFSNFDGVLAFPQTGERLLMADSVLVFSVAGQLEIRQGRIAFLGEIAYASTADQAAWLPDTTRGGNYVMRMLTVDGFAGFRVGPLIERAEVLILAGARYYDWRHELTGMGPTGTRRDRFAAATAGVRFTVGVNRAIRWWAQSDLGLRIGRQTAAWGLRSGLDLGIWGAVNLTIQYRYLEVDYQTQPDEDVNLDGTAQGWYVGLAVTP